MSRFQSVLVGSSVGLALIALVAGLGFGAYAILARDLPSPELLLSYEAPIATKVYDCRDRLIYQFFEERRDPVRLEQIPANLRDAFVLVEDKRFNQHWGLDLVRIGRAALANLAAHRVVQGGSTITQQLARNMFLTHEISMIRKLKEALLSVQLERYYSKREILEMYLNQVYFGQGAYGVEAAANTYFAKHVGELDLAESALLASLIKRPSAYSPYEDPAAGIARRNLFLRKLFEAQRISRAAYDAARSAPIKLAPRRVRINDAPYFIEEVRRYLENRYGSDFVYRSGATVMTTVDIDLQRAANRALAAQLAAVEEEHQLAPRKSDFDTVPYTDTTRPATYVQGALVALDVPTGEVRALIGGRDFRRSPFDRATQALRQPGSAFKVFVYTAAIDNGLSPADIELDAPIVIDIPGSRRYVPSNYDREYLGPLTLRSGLALSRNIIAVRIIRNLGPELVVQYANRMGIRERLNPVMSLALGSSEVTLLDMTAAYACLANAGRRVTPILVTKVIDRAGRVLEYNTPRTEQVLAPTTAYVTVDMMRSVIDAGTATVIRRLGFDRPAAGKTGTTDEYTDAWFVGFTPSICTGVWVGYDEKKMIFRGAQGGRVAAPVWAEFMKAATENAPHDEFTMPKGIVTRRICKYTGLLATSDCPDVRTEVFVQGSEPFRDCEYHRYLKMKQGPNKDFELLDRRSLKAGGY